MGSVGAVASPLGGNYESGENKLGVPEFTWSDDAVEATEIEYSDVPTTAFLVSGPLNPFKKGEVRCLTDHRFDSVEQAEAWAKKKYPRVYKNESRPSQGVWAFRVAPMPSEVA